MQLLLIILLSLVTSVSYGDTCNSYLVRWANLHNSGKPANVAAAKKLYKTIEQKCINARAETNTKPRNTKRKRG